MIFKYLTDDQLYEVQQAAVDSGLAAERTALLAPIDPAYVGGIPQAGATLAQLTIDLNRLNSTRRLTDGSIPLQAWLRQAAMLRPNQEAQTVFRKHGDIVRQMASGEPQDSPKLTEVPSSNEKIIVQDDILPLGFLSGALNASRSVVKLEVPRYLNGVPELDQGGKPVLFAGTAWLIAPTLLITNHHVVKAREFGEIPADAMHVALQSKHATAIFDYESSTRTGHRVPVSELLDADAGLDYAVLRLASDPGRPPLTVLGTPVQLPPTQYLPVNIVQHPLGLEKKVAIRNNLVRQVTETEMQYFTDTQGGSSGSPVLDDSWRVVALHKASRSVTGVSFQGKDTAFVNVGTPIAAICKRLRGTCPAAWAEIAPTVV